MPTLELFESLPIGVELKFNNIYTESGNGAKTAYVHWDQPLLKFDLSRALPETYESIKTYLTDFFKEVKGAETIFRYSDPTDNYVTATVKTGFATDKSWGIGVKNTDGSQYQLFKVYELEGVRSYRPITKPVNNVNFKIFNGTTQITTGFTVNYVTGVITFSPAQPSLNLLWQGNFDVPCRFSTDAIAFITEVAAKEECNHALYSIPSFEILEVREAAIAHPTAPVLPERIKHELALDVNVKEQDELTLNTSVTVFDSGFEVRQANYLETVSNQLQPKVYRKFTTGEITKADDVDLHYMLCLWRCTRGGAIVFQHQTYEVQARETLNIDVQLEEVDKILYPNCKRYPVYDLSSLQLVESGKTFPIFLIPPYTHTVQSLTLNPNLKLSAYKVTTGFNNFPPSSSLLGDWRATKMFWGAGNLWLFVTSNWNNVTQNAAWYNRTALYKLSGNGKFDYVESDLKNYYIPVSFFTSDRTEILKTPTGVSVFIYNVDASVPFPNGVGNNSIKGLLRFEIKNDGSQLIDFIPDTLLASFFNSNSVFTKVVAVFGDKVFVNCTNHLNLNKSIGVRSGLNYIVGNLQFTGCLGFPVGGSNYATGSLFSGFSIVENNFYHTFSGNTKTLFFNGQELARHYIATGYNASAIDFNSTAIKQNQEGVTFGRLTLNYNCLPLSTSCTLANSQNRRLIYFAPDYFTTPQLLDNIINDGNNTNPTTLWLQGFSSGGSQQMNHDRYGNSLYKSQFAISILYYQAGSNVAIDATSIVGGDIVLNNANTPYGFALFSGSGNLFGNVTAKIIFVQPQEI